MENWVLKHMDITAEEGALGEADSLAQQCIPQKSTVRTEEQCCVIVETWCLRRGSDERVVGSEARLTK